VTRFTLGTRASALAIAQVELTRAALHRAFPDMELAVQTFVTRGDRKLDLSLIRASEAGGKGLFTRELEDALLAGSIDAAVHSLKDLPGHNPDGLAITAVLERAATADVLITKCGTAFDKLPPGAALGTSSVRRARQLRHLRPDVRIEEWRGNVQTRLRKLTERDDIAGIILAQAGLDRLGYACADGVIAVEGHTLHIQSLAAHLLPAIGQGAIALQSCADRAEVSAILARIDHAPTHRAIRAERELQRLLAGDCAMPVGVRTTLDGATLRMEAILFPPEEAAAPARAEAAGTGEPEAIAGQLFRALNPTV
jgi:hydroxymethylbilane synthase